MKEEGNMWVSLEKKKKKTKREIWRGANRWMVLGKRGGDFLKFFLSSLLSQIYENRTVGIRRVKNEKCSTQRGLRVGYQKHGISQRIQVKIRKI